MLYIFKNTKVLKKKNLLINGIIFILSYGVLLNFFQGVDYSDSSSIIQSLFSSKESSLYLLLIAFLAVFNWAIESAKWRLSISVIVHISFWDAIKSVLIGVFFSLFVPNRAGDFIGRVYSVKDANKGMLSMLTLLASSAQLMATLLFGTLGVTYFYMYYRDAFLFPHIYFVAGILLSWLASIVFIILYFNASFLTKIGKNNNHPFFVKLKSWTEALALVSSSRLFFIILLSFFRYAIFSLQLWLCYLLLGVDVNLFDLLFFVTVYYLVLTFIPTIIFTEIGVRGSLSIYLFSVLVFITGAPEYNYQWSVSFASVLIWIVNIVIPAVIGSFFASRLKFFNK